MKTTHAALATLLSLATPPAAATNSRAELEGVLADVVAWMPGEYSTAPQLDVERRYGTPPDGEHEDWYRVFALVDAPQVGQHVIYGELRIGGPDGALVKGTQILYNVVVDEKTMTVHANGRRVLDAEQFVRAHERPETWPQLAVDPRFGGNCDFRWTRHGTQVHGILNHDGTCRMVSKVSGKEMSFDAEWVLTPDQLWLFDNNYVYGPGPDDRSLFMGRDDRTHVQLYKVGWYACSVRGLAGAPATLRLRDRGQAERLGQGEGAPELVLLRGYRAGADGTLGEVTTLALHRPGEAPLEARAPGTAARISLQAGELSVGCDRQTH